MMRTSELVAFDERECDSFATTIVFDNEQLLVRLRAGEQAAFEELINRYHTGVYNLALRLMGDREDARDITQETFLKVYSNISKFRGEAELRTWVYRITVNQAANQQRWWRRRRRSSSISIDSAENDQMPLCENLSCPGQTPEQQTLAAEQRRMVIVALARVKFDFRVAVILRDIEGLSYEEIAETLEVSVGTVKSRISRGREELREQLKGSF